MPPELPKMGDVRERLSTSAALDLVVCSLLGHMAAVYLTLDQLRQLGFEPLVTRVSLISSVLCQRY